MQISAIINSGANTAAAVYGVYARNCTFDGNLRASPSDEYQNGNAAANSRLEGCDLNDGNIVGSIVDRCRIHDVPSTVRSIFSGWTRCTNSLIERCEMLAESGTLYFIANSSPMDAEFVNCTFATNRMYTYYTYNQNTATNGIKFVNCLFNGNIDADSRTTDFGARVNSSTGQTWVEHVSCDHSYYGKFTPGNQYQMTAARFYVVTNAPNSLMQCANPRFAQNPKWSLSLRSPILGKGAVADWMDEATDLAGKSRIRGGAVDPGCYQCWLRPLGMIMIIK